VEDPIGWLYNLRWGLLGAGLKHPKENVREHRESLHSSQPPALSTIDSEYRLSFSLFRQLEVRFVSASASHMFAAMVRYQL
jgi:hypothetical protein